MNELVLANKTYGLTKWIGQEEDLKIFSNHILIEKDDFSFIDSGAKIVDQNEPIDVIDVEIKSTIKKAEKMDIAFAAFCGVASAGIDYLFVGKTNFSSLNFKEMKKEDLLKEMPKLLKLMNLSEENIKQAENIFDNKVELFSDKVHNAENYKSMVKDFAAGLSIKGLMISIVEQLIGHHVGLDENGALLVTKFTEEEQINGNFAKKIMTGAILWFVDQATQYSLKNEFSEEVNDVVNLKKQFENVKDLIKELADSKLYKENGFDSHRLKKEMVSLINKTQDDEMQDVLDILAVQAIPVVFNRCLVKTYVIIKSLVEQIKSKNIKSIEGIKYLDFNLTSEDNKRVLARMNTVSTGIFAALDATSAVIPALLKAKQDAEVAFGVTPGDEKAKAVTAMLAAVKGGACEFASRINVANMINLVTVTKVDWNYIVEDLKNHPARFEEADFVKDDPVILESLEKYTTLNKLETKILYSLEYRMVQYDVANTKDSETQIRKDEWCHKWMELSKTATDIKKLFETDEEKLYSLIKTYLGTLQENNWHRILLELSLFKPYFELAVVEKEESDKKQKALKCSNDGYALEVLCKEQKLVEEKDYKGLLKNYKKHYDNLGNMKINPVVGAVGAVAVTAATGGAAFIFAPAIATTLVGGSLAGLYGAALTHASLALIGGGSLAVGGLGMAGGTAIIAGGGALIGLGTSGVTMAALSLMTSSEYAKVDYAKLLTNCEYIMIGKYGKVSEVKQIAKQVAETAEDYKTRYAVLEAKLPDDKKSKKQNQAILKELSKSIDITEDSAKQLFKIVEKIEKKSEEK
ncbi:MAG: hypothetical protein PUE66_04330 [Erysipelotrichaceae bacterium]|nr:hypothetical protein [Erysipelotrichaceae bacterium]